MAQYRAIFQNAYFKGLATAAVVTMGLAAGQAQATANDPYTGTESITGTTITITGNALTDPSTTADHYTKIQVTAANTANLDKNIVISGGTTDANFVKASSATAITFTANSLKIETDTNTKGLSIDGTTGKSTANFTDNVDLVLGTLALKGTNSSELTTPSIKFNGAAADKAILDITKGTAGTADTAIEFTADKFGTVKFQGTNAADAVLKGTFEGNGSAKLDFSAGKGTISAKGTLANADITIAAGKDASISLAKATDSLSIQSGTITVTGADGALTVAQGILDLAEPVKLTAKTNDGATITVTDTLKLSKAQLTSFLTSDGDTTDNKGKVSIGASGVLSLKDSGQVNIDDLTFGSAAGNVTIEDGSTIAANDLVVGKGLTSAANLVLKANTLTLGSAEFDSSKTTPFGFKSATAKNVNFISGSNKNPVGYIKDSGMCHVENYTILTFKAWELSY